MADPTRPVSPPPPTPAVPAPPGEERRAIARIAACLPAPPPGELWIGDDAAIVEVGGAVLVIAADALAAGVHADLSLTTMADLGWKALAVNVSDLAAMGCAAARALVTVSGPPCTDIDALYQGLGEASVAFGCAIVGGDLTAAASLVVSVSVVGDGRVVPPPVRRSGARPGDEVWVSGPLGAAAAGLRALREHRSALTSDALVAAHARPVPRVAEGMAAREMGATAMIDVSDGFGADLGRILDASGVGCDLEAVPVAEGAGHDEALGGGDDYELVWCCPPRSGMAEGFARRGLRKPILVGHCLGDPEVRLLAGERLAATGWVHAIGAEVSLAGEGPPAGQRESRGTPGEPCPSPAPVRSP